MCTPFGHRASGHMAMGPRKLYVYLADAREESDALEGPTITDV